MKEIINKGYLAYLLEKEYIIVGELIKGVNESNTINYVFDIDKNSLDLLGEKDEIIKSQTENGISIPGIDLDNGYYQVHDKTPFFITMRTPDRRRLDMEEILERYNLDYYDQFEILLRNEGYSLDNWRILRDLNSKPVSNKN